MTLFDALPGGIHALQVEAPDLLQWIEARDPKAAEHWSEAGRAEYARAFTAARTAGYDVVNDIYFGFADTIERGGTEADFQKLLVPVLREKGWLGGNDGAIAKRLQLIYDTNLRLARASGRWARYQRTKHVFPYLRAFTAGDERVRHPPKSRDDHRAWDGIILPVDHPFWQRWFPPLGFRCRCSVVQMSRSQLARYKGGVTSEAELADREARLGTPIFAAPGAPIEVAAAQMVAATNERRLPGLPEISSPETVRQGSSIWASLLADIALDELDDLVARILGKAA